eukprot:TRINITY_DN12361_c0_g3_i1.p1 TRINITY_DN12361_c0_g3~~TRINITY_DN12361_c0_g3_i1.p1  ORF type:complete len:161 (-),score=42.23 TRINITY_DN12361_c0_g3_i1:35-517(-)
MKNAFYQPEDSSFVEAYIAHYLDTPMYKQSAYPTIKKAWDLNSGNVHRVIDFACGTGVQTRVLKAKTGGEVIGLDNSVDMLNAAMQQEEEQKQGIRYVLADCFSDVTAIPEVSAMMPFDLINAAWLICHEEKVEGIRCLAKTSFKPVSYTHLTLPTICSV